MFIAVQSSTSITILFIFKKDKPNITGKYKFDAMTACTVQEVYLWFIDVTDNLQYSDNVVVILVFEFEIATSTMRGSFKWQQCMPKWSTKLVLIKIMWELSSNKIDTFSGKSTFGPAIMLVHTKCETAIRMSLTSKLVSELTKSICAIVTGDCGRMVATVINKEAAIIDVTAATGLDAWASETFTTSTNV